MSIYHLHTTTITKAANTLLAPLNDLVDSMLLQLKPSPAMPSWHDSRHHHYNHLLVILLLSFAIDASTLDGSILVPPELNSGARSHFPSVQPDLEALQRITTATSSTKRDLSDPRRIMCGFDLIVNLKMQCGDLGTYSPNERAPRVRRDLRLGRRKMSYGNSRKRGRRFDDLCSVYLRYEPFTIVTECCCRGCTRRFLDQFCSKA